MTTKMCRWTMGMSLFAGMAALPVWAGDAAQAKVGAKAPEFSLKDADGKAYNLADYAKQGKIVVLEWFNADCPYCQNHAKDGTMIKLVKDYGAKNVVFLGVDSTAAHQGKESDLKAKIAEWKLNYAILTDYDGKVGKMYGATNTPHMFIIGKDGVLVYNGAIDDQGETNYVKQALEEVLAGKTVSKSQTKPYGCSVKYKG